MEKSLWEQTVQEARSVISVSTVRRQKGADAVKKGCLEQYASATGIARLAGKYLEHYDEQTLLSSKSISAKTVFDAVKEGDKAAVEIAEKFGRYLGCALANLAVITDPAVIVIGGGVSKAGPVLLPFIEKPFRESAFFCKSGHEVCSCNSWK